MNKKELIVQFMTQGEKNFSLRIPNPKDNLNETLVRPVAEQMIAGQIFRDKDPIKTVESAYILTTNQEVIM